MTITLQTIKEYINKDLKVELNYNTVYKLIRSLNYKSCKVIFGKKENRIFNWRDTW